MNREEYLNICYAAWLGKIIGIRLGAPVENKTASEIAALYPVIDGYPVDYGCFAADDDSNGPLFYIRALEKSGMPLELAVGQALLSYIPEYSGFFWWGGVGVSTEHTAYENLKNGLLPPQSGSAAQNGLELAEQIGGQIFSDCWGYVAGGNPSAAADMAARAASVTHDGNGIEGARFIAAAVAAAFTESSIESVMQAALLQLDPSKQYYKTVCDIMRFWHEAPGEPELCLKYIQDNYGYDRYGGVCHIIPNAALIVMALCYGGGDFERTLCLLCSCGWDTDCNCGNAGSILGALVGLAGIPEGWIAPINDLLVASSSVGFLNNQTVSASARDFAAAAESLRAGLPAEFGRGVKHLVFELPYETRAFFCEGGRAFQSGGALNVEFDKSALLLKRSYFLPGELYDTRYEPTFSPLVYPGERLTAVVDGHGIACRLVCRTDSGELIEGEPVTLSGITELSFVLPAGSYLVHDFGLSLSSHSAAAARLISFDADSRADFSVDTLTLKSDDYGMTFGGTRLVTPRGFVVHSGGWSLGGGLCCEGNGLITTGDIFLRDYTLSCSLSAENGGLVFCHSSSGSFHSVEIVGGCVEICSYSDRVRTTLKAVTIQSPLTNHYFFTIGVRYDKIALTINEQSKITVHTGGSPLSGGFGLISHVGGFTKCFGFSLRCKK